MKLTSFRRSGYQSPSVWREWIEISSVIGHSDSVERLPPCGGSGLKFACIRRCRTCYGSPSVWREWIEISVPPQILERIASPSVWREWIEIPDQKRCCGSVGGLPPCGGSGLKLFSNCFSAAMSASPSVWREWIEMRKSTTKTAAITCLPPCGGSGLKFRYNAA